MLARTYVAMRAGQRTRPIIEASEQIGRMWRAGFTIAEIARATGRKGGAIHYHATQVLGLPPRGHRPRGRTVDRV